MYFFAFAVFISHIWIKYYIFLINNAVLVSYLLRLVVQVVNDDGSSVMKFIKLL